MSVGISIKAEGRSINMMTIKQIKEEVYYYIGKHITDGDAEEILGFVEDNSETSLDEIIQEYFSC